jgi:hypothetical protein
MFLMHLWKPNHFPVLNAPVEQALRTLDMNLDSQGSKRKAQAYKDHAAAVEAVAKLAGLRSFAQVDHFLDAIGKGDIGRRRVIS